MATFEDITIKAVPATSFIFKLSIFEAFFFVIVIYTVSAAILIPHPDLLGPSFMK